MIDIGFKGAPFTWNNKRVGKENIQERLDRGFINGEWRTIFPQAYVSHLTALNSDHRPLLLHTNPVTSASPKPFRFESMWTRDPNATDVILKAWSRPFRGDPITTLLSKLRTTKEALKAWNRHSFGNIQMIIKTLTDHIEQLQNLPSTKPLSTWKPMHNSN